MSQIILITGGAGFIGANFVKMLLKQNVFAKIINFDALTYASNLSYLSDVDDDSRYQFIKGDIRDANLVKETFAKYQVTDVIHFAAESHVDNSISNPAAFIETNVNGTFNLLEAARGLWLAKPFEYRPGCERNRFLHISTDEVYGTLGPTGYFTEETPYAPNSPYSASKASSDMIVRSYHHTYGLNTLITNCSNNYGPNQHDEKLIPTIIRNALKGNPIPIYGDGKNIRDWLFVLDHCRGIWDVFEKGKFGETFNIGGNSEKQNLEVCYTICDILQELRPRAGGHYRDLITFVKDRPGHDRRYAIDASKIKREVGWVPNENFQTGIRKTAEWYLSKYVR